LFKENLGYDPYSVTMSTKVCIGCLQTCIINIQEYPYTCLRCKFADKCGLINIKKIISNNLNEVFKND